MLLPYVNLQLPLLSVMNTERTSGEKESSDRWKEEGQDRSIIREAESKVETTEDRHAESSPEYQPKYRKQECQPRRDNHRFQPRG